MRHSLRRGHAGLNAMELTNYSQIRQLLARHGFRFSKSKGQNFLTAAWVPERIAQQAQLDSGCGVLEVGPGVGCLTEQLAMRAGRVLAVELDEALRPVLAETLAGQNNVELIFGDVLKLDLGSLVAEKLAGLRPVVCANLPYNITSPLLTAFIEAHCFESITVMIQREVARRLCAAAGPADYGAFTVYVNWHCQPQALFDVPASCFVPQPKVTSSVIRLLPREGPPFPCDERLFFRIVRCAFNQRRKTLVNALGAGIPLPRAEIEKAVVRAGFDPRIRGEALDIAGFAALTEELSVLL